MLFINSLILQMFYLISDKLKNKNDTINANSQHEKYIIFYTVMMCLYICVFFASHYTVL